MNVLTQASSTSHGISMDNLNGDIGRTIELFHYTDHRERDQSCLTYFYIIYFWIYLLKTAIYWIFLDYVVSIRELNSIDISVSGIVFNNLLGVAVIPSRLSLDGIPATPRRLLNTIPLSSMVYLVVKIITYNSI